LGHFGVLRCLPKVTGVEGDVGEVEAFLFHI
jgi:hypothetical protein